MTGDAQDKFDRAWRMYRIVAPICIALIAVGLLVKLVEVVLGG
jgi:hypothetical protein